MVRRSLEWVGCVGVAIGLGGCAQAPQAESAGPKLDSTAEMVSRSADAMQRFWDEGKAGAEPDKTGVDASNRSPAGRAATVAPAPRNSTVVARGPAEMKATQQTAIADEPKTQEIAATAAPDVRVPAMAAAVPTPTPSVVLAAPTVAHRSGAGVSGFFSGEAVSSGAEVAPKGPSLRIGALALCSKVEGFGRFTRMETARITGRPVALLVYTQVDGFAYRTTGGATSAPDDGKTQWVVDLGQAVVVYRLSADGKEPDEQVLYVPEQPCRDVALGKRRDHFLVQRIELSPWLVAGKYAVKVTVRDKATGQVDERITDVTLR